MENVKFLVCIWFYNLVSELGSSRCNSPWEDLEYVSVFHVFCVEYKSCCIEHCWSREGTIRFRSHHFCCCEKPCLKGASTSK
jgi:hypothetical protein